MYVHEIGPWQRSRCTYTGGAVFTGVRKRGRRAFFVALKVLVFRWLAQRTGAEMIPVCCANALCVTMLSARFTYFFYIFASKPLTHKDMKPDYLKNFFDWNRAVDFWKGLGKDKQIGLVSALIALIMILLPSGNSLKRKGYDIDLPRGAGKIKYKAVSEEHLAQLNDRNLQFVSQPVNVTTRKGDSHVQLEKMARVSFPIPKNIPKKERINLIGVLLTDDGPVYMIPDYMELQKGMDDIAAGRVISADAVEAEMRSLHGV